LVELPGRAGAVEFWQSGPIWVKVGVISVVTSISIVISAAHWPAAGVKVYVVVPTVVVLITAGLQVPVIPLVELPGRAGAVEFWQSGPIWVKTGVMAGLTVMIRVAVVAHWSSSGVNVYSVVAVLLIIGLQVPVMPFREVSGKAGIADPLQ
jgi:hypothetical protein